MATVAKLAVERRRCSSCSENASRRWAVGYRCGESESETVKTCCASMPSGICWYLQRARSNSPAALSRASENASCATINTCLIRSEEHTSELQSLRHLVCRLLLEK